MTGQPFIECGAKGRVTQGHLDSQHRDLSSESGYGLNLLFQVIQVGIGFCLTIQVVKCELVSEFSVEDRCGPLSCLSGSGRPSVI